MKKNLISELLLYPCPVTLVTSKHEDKENVLAVSWIGIGSSHPEHVCIGIKKTRYSHQIINASSIFGVNIINSDLIKKADYCGSITGMSINKFDACSFSKLYGKATGVPLIEDCPVNLECKVVSIQDLGSHDLFIGKVVNKLIDCDIDIESPYAKLNPVVYFRPNYYMLEKESLGSYGYTIEF